MSDSFLPSDYKIPSNSSFYSFKDGVNKFRILGSAILGWEYWNKDEKPVRMKSAPPSIPIDIKIEKDEKTGASKPSRVMHFWAFPVWNFDEKRVQVLQLRQSTIQEPIKALVDNPDWGDPKGYNITVTRKGSGFSTEYNVQPSPKSDVPIEVVAAYEMSNLNLNNIFENKDPFSGKTSDEVPM